MIFHTVTPFLLYIYQTFYILNLLYIVTKYLLHNVYIAAIISSESTLKPESALTKAGDLTKISPSSSQLALTFCPSERIDHAYSKLSEGVKEIISLSNFDTLSTCSPGQKVDNALSQLTEAPGPVDVIESADVSSTFSKKLVNTNYAIKLFNDLFLILTNSNYWNFLDIRMMEAMVNASMLPAAQQSLENFKKSFLNMKLSEVVPYYMPKMLLKTNHVILNEVLNKDFRHLTIAELYQHHHFLETELLDFDIGTLSCCEIKEGSVIIEWQIHVNYVYQVFMLLKTKKVILSSQAITCLSFPDALKWVGLPVTWIGQERGQTGTIEPKPAEIRTQPYLLPKGFEWICLNPETSPDELNSMLDPKDVEIFRSHWFANPNVKTLGIRSSTTKKLVEVIWGTPICVSIGGNLLTMVQISTVQICNTYLLNVVYNIAMKELMRQFQLDGIYQAMFSPSLESQDKAKSITSTSSTEIVKPVVTLTTRHFKFGLHPLPYSIPQTTGLRKMTSKDIPSALAMTNKYTSQFEIGQVFQSEKEFSLWFLPAPLPTKGLSIVTYVVEDPSTGELTDMFSFQIKPKLYGRVTAIVNTKTPTKQLIVDLLLCARQEEVPNVEIYQYGLNKELFVEIHAVPIELPVSAHISVLTECPMYLYNYNYPEVHEDNFVLFSYLSQV